MVDNDVRTGRRAFIWAAGTAAVAPMLGLSGTAFAAEASAATAPAGSHTAGEADTAFRNVVFPPAPLARQPFQLLPTGAVRPTGWLRRQLQVQADGLGGHLDETWADVGPDSGWLGGKGESWERGPYFLDGLLPLAWQLDSEPLKAKARRFIDWTLDHPWPNGMFGPRGNDDWWPRMVMLKVLTQFHELTGDPRVIPLMTNYFAYQLQALPTRPLRDWGRMRWQDELVSVVWLYSRTQDPRLLELAKLLQKQGYDWQGMFANFPFKTKVDPDAIKKEAHGGDAFMEDIGLQVHGVNNAQALKASPVWSQVSGKSADREAVHHQLAMLDQYHGLPNGMFSADEHLAGRSPSQGVELCAVVEAMYSLELALAITGDAAIADRLERVAFNALPGTFTDDMWAHQYDQQPNQVESSLHRRPWTTNGPEANLFGLEPHFGCCTANFHQGWPKFTASLWMATADGGLAAAAYAPCEVATTVRGVPLRLEQVTDYPFRQQVRITLHPESQVAFPLRLRIPGWSARTAIKVNGKPVGAGAAGSFATLQRTWKAGDTVELTFDAHPVAEAGFNGSHSFTFGALVFSLPIRENWVQWRKRGLTADWQVYPGSRWNYGVSANAKVKVSEHALPVSPFAGAPALTLAVEGQSVPAWKAEEGAADPVPASAKSAVDEPATILTLVPYAVAKLRITSFPVISAPS
jgi:glycosyl hydrolase family 127 (putative beta-L-arabinofuranosidase)/beta-L-arabinofuranosidase (glycosyl hydrolase family 127)